MMYKILGAFIFLVLLILSFASADVITPTVTNVYFEKNGQFYNNSIDFVVKGYGYSWSPGPEVKKEPGSLKKMDSSITIV